LLPTTIYHFSTLGIVWSLFVVGPPTDEFLKNALSSVIYNLYAPPPIYETNCPSKTRKNTYPTLLSGAIPEAYVVVPELNGNNGKKYPQMADHEPTPLND
jgi:hypothetical protein